MTDTELIKALQKCEFGTGLVIVDSEGREFEITDVSTTMGGQFHQVLELKEIKDPHEKWFRTKEIYLEQLEEELKVWKGDEMRNLHLKKYGNLDKLEESIKKHERFIEHVKKSYKPGEIVD